MNSAASPPLYQHRWGGDLLAHESEDWPRDLASLPSKKELHAWCKRRLASTNRRAYLGKKFIERSGWAGYSFGGERRFSTLSNLVQPPLEGFSGEQVFLDCSTPSLISNQIVSFGSTKTYLVRTELPKVIPPSYRGTAIRYLYHVRSMLSGRWLTLENGHPHQESLENLIQLEDRIPLQIWVTQKASSFLNEDDQSDGTSPAMAFQMDIYWKENNGDSEWARANDTSDGVEEGYESSRDEISSVSSYNPTKGNLDLQFEKSLSIKSSLSRHSNKETPCMQGDRVSFSSMGPPRLSTAEDSYDHDVVSPNKMPPVFSPRQQAKHAYLIPANDTEVPSTCGTDESVASEGFIRGKSYNIRLDDQVLLRFCPKNSDSTYYFSDMIGGTLTFFHEGARRCLELSITLEASETISQQFVHPSRRNSPTITKVQSDHHEVVADLVQTSFLFSIPVDGPMSFSSPHVSVQWALRFEFFTTPKNVDWTSYEHPLLIEGRDKGEWVLPITVHVPTLRAQAAHTRNDRSLSPGPLS
ncbi:PREDICTED: uncharacterized protein LOC104592759 [Nelumbo nucifera]|uniref:Uncharacterized protein LOC104592759 n=1 Tax=Nelumbo nucifera TaxID=4432 RepID=A0A1U7ZCR1_NELNU|nr:PREDICTED: uncharacterized protein LOC104592759 [Nelumbo nucifera]